MEKPRPENPQAVLYARHREQLYELLDENYDRFFNNKPLWPALHALDKEITPKCIRVEDAPSAPAKHIVSGEDTSELFSPGEKTLVFSLKTQQAALNTAKLLNKVFYGCGTVFVPEVIEGPKATYQVRSNIDKRHWEKLCLFCAYRFDREITDPEQRKQLQTQCKEVLNTYTKGTPSEKWVDAPGVPAFCAIMGLHGNLRPKERYKPDHVRKQRELNDPHHRGVPLLFQGVIVHVDMKKNGEVAFTIPYEMGYNINRSAIEEVTDRKRYWELLLETCGGNPFDGEIAPSRRVIAGVGLLLGSYGLYHGGEEIIGVIGPAASAAAATTVLAITYVDHRTKLLDRLMAGKKAVEEHLQRMRAKGKTVQLSADAIDNPIAVIPEELAEAYGGNEVAGLSDEFGNRVWRDVMRRMSLTTGAHSEQHAKAEQALAARVQSELGKHKKPHR